MSDLTPMAATAETNPEDIAIRDFILDLAEQYAAKEIDHWGVRRMSNGHDRWTATRHTPLADPRRPALLRLLDDLIAQDPTQQYGWQYRTKHGLFSSAELRGAEAAMVQDGDRLLIRFPVRYGLSGPEFKPRAA